MLPLNPPRLLPLPPRWLAALVALLLTCNLGAFKVATPAAACQVKRQVATKACCLAKPTGCCCVKPEKSQLPAATLQWRAFDCGTTVVAGLLHHDWDPILLLEDEADASPEATTAPPSELPPPICWGKAPPTPPPRST